MSNEAASDGVSVFTGSIAIAIFGQVRRISMAFFFSGDCHWSRKNRETAAASFIWEPISGGLGTTFLGKIPAFREEP